MIDEHSLLGLASCVGRRCKAKDVVMVLEEFTGLDTAPAFIRSDNGPEFDAHAPLRLLMSNGTTAAYFQRGSPWKNGFPDSFNSRFRDEFLNTELFATVAVAKGLANCWRYKYDYFRPRLAPQGYWRQLK